VSFESATSFLFLLPFLAGRGGLTLVSLKLVLMLLISCLWHDELISLKLGSMFCATIKILSAKFDGDYQRCH